MLPTTVCISVAFSILLLKWALHRWICKTSLKREVATPVLGVRRHQGVSYQNESVSQW